jgi:hypothetical protein
MSTNGDWCAHWRASAYESVPYIDYLPECLLVLPELVDGSLAQGNASKISINIHLKPDGSATLTLEDNGKGITNCTRLLSWASTTSTETHHRYGHGSKKCLTKFMRDYERAEWSISYRTCDKKGKSGSLFTLKGPFLGINTKGEENETDEEKHMPSGTGWTINFDANILGKYCTIKGLFDAIKELLRVRYSKKYFDQAEFILSVSGTVCRGKKSSCQTVQESSRENTWHTFQEGLDMEVASRNARILHEQVRLIEGGTMVVKAYALLIDGKKAFNLKKDFPIYGQRNMKCSLCHMALDGRVIETLPMYKVCGREANHNDFNGRILCVNFIPDASDPKAFEKFPTPSTTKVSFYPNCPKFQECMNMIKDICTSTSSESDSDSSEQSAATSVEQPANTTVTPTPTLKKRVVKKPVPTTVQEQPTSTVQQPASAPKQPTSTVQQPAPVHEEPAPATEQPPAEQYSSTPTPPEQPITSIPPPPPAAPITTPKPNNPITFTKSRPNEIVVLENEVAIAKLSIHPSTCADWIRILEKYSLEFGSERFKTYIVVQKQIADAFFE